jgi:hypothetical protein
MNALPLTSTLSPEARQSGAAVHTYLKYLGDAGGASKAAQLAFRKALTRMFLDLQRDQDDDDDDDDEVLVQLTEEEGHEAAQEALREVGLASDSDDDDDDDESSEGEEEVKPKSARARAGSATARQDRVRPPRKGPHKPASRGKKAPARAATRAGTPQKKARSGSRGRR